MRVEPGQNPLEAVKAQVRRAGACEAVVGFGRVADVFDGAAEAAEGGEELIGLLDGAAEVAFAVEDEEWGVDTAVEVQRRGSKISKHADCERTH